MIIRGLTLYICSAVFLAGASPSGAQNLSGPPTSATESCMVFPDQGRVCRNLNLYANYVVRDDAERFVERNETQPMAWWQAMIGHALAATIRKHNERGIRANNIAVRDVMPH